MHAADRRFTKDSELVTRRIAGETIIVPVRSHVGDLESIYSLNETASFLWELIDGRRTVRQLADALVEQYDVSPDQAMADVAELAESLEPAGLVRLSTETEE